MKPIKRRDMGIAGAIIVLSQAVTSLKSSQSITDKMEQIKEQMAIAKNEQEEYFVRKSELVKVVAKIDKIGENVAVLKDQIKDLRRHVKHHPSFDSLEVSVRD